MAKMVILRAEMLLYDDKVKYHACSPLFEKLKEGERCPEYAIEVNSETGEVAARRLDD
jgi:hypothetical protein